MSGCKVHRIPQSAEPRPFAVGPGEGATLDLANGNRVEFKADSAQTAGLLTFVEGTQTPGTGPPLHVHDDADELFYILEGRFTIFCGNEAFDARPRSLVYVPRGTPHRFVTGAEPGRMLLLYLPGGFEGYFLDRAAREAAAGSQLSAAELDAIGRRYGMRLVEN